jgi:CO/xanthine dehydrogenase FAD-binding subunit
MIAAVFLIKDRRIATARIAVGSCSVNARRLTTLECDLAGASIDDDLDALVTATQLAPLSPIDDMRATAAYRLDASLTMIRRVLKSCVEAN